MSVSVRLSEVAFNVAETLVLTLRIRGREQNVAFCQPRRTGCWQAGMCTRPIAPRPRRDQDRDVAAPETLAETYGENH